MCVFCVYIVRKNLNFRPQIYPTPSFQGSLQAVYYRHGPLHLSPVPISFPAGALKALAFVLFITCVGCLLREAASITRNLFWSSVCLPVTVLQNKLAAYGESYNFCLNLLSSDMPASQHMKAKPLLQPNRYSPRDKAIHRPIKLSLHTIWKCVLNNGGKSVEHSDLW